MHCIYSGIAKESLAEVTLNSEKIKSIALAIVNVCKLQKAGIPNNKIIAVTGHRNEMSLKAYSDVVDVDDHKKN